MRKLSFCTFASGLGVGWEWVSSGLQVGSKWVASDFKFASGLGVIA